MADEDKGLSAKEQNSIAQKVITELRRSRAETTKGQEKAREAFEKNIDNQEGLSDAVKTMAKNQGMLEQNFGFGKEQAKQIAMTTDALKATNEKIDAMESTAKETNQDLNRNTEYERLILEKKQLEEQQKFGRNLTGFERATVKIFGGKFDDLKKSVEEGGSRTQAEIFKSVGQDLSGDLDKVLTFLGPVGGFLQQIPLLGTLLNFIGRQASAIAIRIAMSIKRNIFDRKQQGKIDKKNLQLALRNDKRQEKIARNQTKQTMVQGTTTTAAAPDSPDEGDDAQGGGSFRAASIFLGVAAASGVAAGAGLTAAAAGMSAFATAAFKFSGALAVGGLALGVGLTGIFGSFALGQKMGAFEGMKEFGKVNMLKVLGSMLGLATLMGVLGAIVTTGVGALIMGVGAIAVMALIGTLVVIGKGLGEFATSILPFETMNVPRIKQNIQQLASISGEIDELMDISGGRGIIAQALTDHPLKELATALDEYRGDFTERINNITNLKTALKGFEFPEMPESETGWGSMLRGWTGEDFSGELKKLSKLQIATDLGTKLGLVGDGLLKIGDGLGNITDKKVQHLEAITEALGDMKNVDLNFNASVSSTDITPTSTTQSQGQNNNVVVAPQVSNRVSNNIKRFNATGSNMMNHSALHYPSLG